MRMRRTVCRTYQAGRLVATLLLILCAACAAEPLQPGKTRVISHGYEHYTLEANDAHLSDVLAAIDRAIEADLQITDIPDRKVTVRYQDVTIEDMLERLAVNCILWYERAGGEEEFRLAEGRTLARGLPLSPEVKAFVRQVRSFIRDLADDDKPFNAMKAMSRLRSAGTNAIPELEKAMASDDYQTRQFAADVLYSFSKEYEPTDRFLEELIAGMRDDQYPYGKTENGRHATVWVMNARRGYEFFDRRPEMVERARHMLAKQLYSDDPQQRLLCALLLGKHGATEHAERLTTILIPHLADNDLRSDHRLAAHALHKLGPTIRPHLTPYLESADEQQRKLVELILYHFDHPDAGPVAGYRILQGMGFLSDPVLQSFGIQFGGWRTENFPDIDGDHRIGY